MNQTKLFLFSLFFLAFQANSRAQAKHYYQIAGGLGVAQRQHLTLVTNPLKSFNTISGRFGALYVNQKEGSFTYKTGLNFTIIGEKFGLSDAQWGTQHNGNGGFDPNLPGEPIRYVVQKSYFLEVPFLFHFAFRKNTKWTPYGEIGLAGNILVASGFKTINNDGSVVKGNSTSSLKDDLVFLPSAIANVGLQYEYKPNQFIFVQPSFTVVTTKLNRKIQIHSNMYLFNVEIGARYAL
jgi:hypothetical protein